MFRDERQTKILEILERDGRVSTMDLADQFDVSVDSIRKDLQRLAAEGMCRRVYGGATTIDPDVRKKNVVERLDERRAQKELIARKAFGLIRDGMTIFLDISSTNVHLASLLGESERHVIVVTNMMEIAMRAAKGPGIDVQCPGGHVNAELNGLVGSVTVSDLHRRRFDLAFLGTLEMDVEHDSVSTYDAEDGTVKQVVLANSAYCYVVADSLKFGGDGPYQYARLSDFYGVITDDDLPEKRARLEELGIVVL